MKLAQVIEVLNAHDIYLSNMEYVSWLEVESILVVACQMGEENRTYVFKGSSLSGYLESDVFPKSWDKFKQKQVIL